MKNPTLVVSVGELLDKLSILEIKKNKIDNKERLIYIIEEYEIISKVSFEFLENSELQSIYEKLININTKLWDIEDRLREFEKIQYFGPDFIEDARMVYKTNDERFRVKNEINIKTKSMVREQKSYK